MWIPGLMAGMVLAGSNPVAAAIYQFVVVAMLYATAGSTALLCTLFVRSRAFSPAEQLTRIWRRLDYEEDAFPDLKDEKQCSMSEKKR